MSVNSQEWKADIIKIIRAAEEQLVRPIDSYVRIHEDRIDTLFIIHEEFVQKLKEEMYHAIDSGLKVDIEDLNSDGQLCDSHKIMACYIHAVMRVRIFEYMEEDYSSIMKIRGENPSMKERFPNEFLAYLIVLLISSSWGRKRIEGYKLKFPDRIQSFRKPNFSGDYLTHFFRLIHEYGENADTFPTYAISNTLFLIEAVCDIATYDRKHFYYA